MNARSKGDEMSNQQILSRYKALSAGLTEVYVAGYDGTRVVSRGKALGMSADEPLIVLNAALTGSRIGRQELSGLDLLELWAFMRPARFCVPTPAGLARALGMEVPLPGADEAAFLLVAAEAMLAEIADPDWLFRGGAHSSLQALMRLKWPWAGLLLPLVPAPPAAERSIFVSLPEWEDQPPRPKPLDVRLESAVVRARLAQLTEMGAEDRPGQQLYADAVRYAFDPRETESAPNVSLAEAGTGTGKTLGYLAPASLWADQARGTVWVSTYTKALQRQLDQELSKLYPDRTVKARKAVVRKGRENYLCLLNLEEAINGVFAGRAAVLAHLASRWARYTRDGDMVGGDFPSWLIPLFGTGRLAALTDRRGECVYSACPHYRRCFIERSTRKAVNADIVVANHALVMINAARGRSEGQGMTRLVLDEGHHIFDAADNTFAIRLTGSEALEMRRWFLGPENPTGRSRGGRRRGLEARLSEIMLHDDDIARHLALALQMARALPSSEWLARCIDGEPANALEAFFGSVRAHVFTRAAPEDAGYGLEAEISQPLPTLVQTAQSAIASLDALAGPLTALEMRLEAILEEQPDWLESSLRPRVEGAMSGIKLRRQTLIAWTALLGRIGAPAQSNYVDWALVERGDGREYDAGLARHWLDPTVPFAKIVLEPAQGVVVTSATLRDRAMTNALDDWSQADMRTGAAHLALPPKRFHTASPFNYRATTRVFIVTDVKRGDIPQLAGAYRALIEAAGGGALGLFTAIARLKAVYARLAPQLAQAGLPLYAQHVDPIDTGTLVDLFRADHSASLLGTDALRDGVDVPGESLRLVVMEGVPWPRPTILHGARRAAFGGTAYDDMVTRAKLAQAFGRLIRRQTDRGVFVLLGAAVPSRLLSAFPEQTIIERIGLSEAVRALKTFLDLPVSNAAAARHNSVPG
jgi:ATP-dependent DNA helicase DinG